MLFVLAPSIAHASEGPLVHYDVQVSDLDGTQFQPNSCGKVVLPAATEDFFIDVSAQDLRTDVSTGGLFAGSADLTYSVDVIDFDGFEVLFPGGAWGQLDEPNQLVNDAGGIWGFDGIAVDPQTSTFPPQALYRVEASIPSSSPLGGQTTLALDPGDVNPAHETLVFGINQVVDARYGSIVIAIGAGPGDFNADGIVDATDLNLVLFNWHVLGGALPASWIAGRPAQDQPVGTTHLNLVLFNWNCQ